MITWSEGVRGMYRTRKIIAVITTVAGSAVVAAAITVGPAAAPAASGAGPARPACYAPASALC